MHDCIYSGRNLLEDPLVFKPFRDLVLLKPVVPDNAVELAVKGAKCTLGWCILQCVVVYCVIKTDVWKSGPLCWVFGLYPRVFGRAFSIWDNALKTLEMCRFELEGCNIVKLLPGGPAFATRQVKPTQQRQKKLLLSHPYTIPIPVSQSVFMYLREKFFLQYAKYMQEGDTVELQGPSNIAEMRCAGLPVGVSVLMIYACMDLYMYMHLYMYMQKYLSAEPDVL